MEENGRGILIALNLIDWAEADRNWTLSCISELTPIPCGTIEGIERKLDSERFLRINRSSLIRVDFIRELQKWTHGEYRLECNPATRLCGLVATWTVKKRTVLFLDSSTREPKGCSLPWKEHRTYKTSPAKGQSLPAAASWVRPLSALCLMISGQRRLNWREQGNALIQTG